MSFFFGKKKGQTPSADAPRSGAASRDPSGGGPNLNAAPVNGVKGKVPPVAGAPTAQTPTPGSSVNNSISNSINGAKTPSPDQGRDGSGVGVAGDRERAGGSVDEGQVRSKIVATRLRRGGMHAIRRNQSWCTNMLMGSFDTVWAFQNRSQWSPARSKPISALSLVTATHDLHLFAT